MSEEISRSKSLNRLRVKNYREKSKRRRFSDGENKFYDSEDDESDSVPTTSLVETIQFPHNENKNVIETDYEETREVDNSILIEHEDKESYVNRFSSSDETDDYESESSDNNSSENDEVQSTNESRILKDLRKWAVDNVIPYKHVDALLKILKPHHSELPLSSKTLLRLKSNFQKDIKKFNPENELDDSEIIYFGITKQLQRIIDPSLHKIGTLELQFNADGLPLYTSSTKEFWPLLGKVYLEEITYQPFVISVYCGNGKPSCVKKYLADFNTELTNILNNGVDIKDKHFEVKIKCFICDMPARAFLKCIKGHTGYFACERCTVKGCRYKNRTVYPAGNSDRRTDTSFRNLENAEHHNDVSPLTTVTPKIDMVNHFVLDFMHLACLGVMKKLLTEYWMKSPILSRDNILRISQRMMRISNQIPNEFQRTTRSLGEINKWKATEFRFFLLYAGIFVLQGILPDALYKHFLLFSISSRILSCKTLCKLYADHTEIYLEKFVQLAAKLYGEESLTMNMHCLSHLTEDVKNLNCSLSELTAFPFESTLGKLKRYLRSGRKPLPQLCRRLEQEIIFCKDKENKVAEYEILKSKKCDEHQVIQKMKFNSCQLTNKYPNNIILLKSGVIVEITKLYCPKNTKDINAIKVTGKKIEIVNSGFDYPSDSAALKIFKIKQNVAGESIDAELKDIDCKLILLHIFELPEDEKESYVLPLLHMN